MTRTDYERDQRLRQDCRRYREEMKDPNRIVPPPWKVTRLNSKESAWTWERDKAGAIIKGRQNIRTPFSGDVEGKFAASRFICVLDDSCMIGGEALTPGVEITCFASAAMTLHQLRGRIIEEIIG